MKFEDYKLIADCLCGQRTLYHYYPDRYAFMLLGWAAGNGTRLEALRKGAYGALRATIWCYKSTLRASTCSI